MKRRVAKEILRIAKSIVSGASEFSVLIHESDAKKAFDKAVSYAQYDAGHGGYTGTIAEKAGYGFKIVSEPVPPSVAKSIAREKMDDNDKWGPAFAIPVTDDYEVKIVPVKLKVEADSSEDAVKLVFQKIQEKYRKFEVSWKEKPQTTVLKPTRWDIKVTKKTAPKLVPEFGFTLDRPFRGSKNMRTPKEAIDGAKRLIEELVKGGGELPESVKFFVSARPVEFMLGEVSNKGGKKSTFEVVGNVSVLLKSNLVKSYLFFGLAAD